MKVHSFRVGNDPFVTFASETDKRIAKKNQLLYRFKVKREKQDSDLFMSKVMVKVNHKNCDQDLFSFKTYCRLRSDQSNQITFHECVTIRVHQSDSSMKAQVHAFQV
jgi:hypothetical protein